MAWHGPHGSQLYYEDAGRGETVVVLPGWSGSIADLGNLRRELSDGFRVIAADLPGSGRSQPQPRRYVPSYYADDARTLLNLLDELEVDAAHFVGFSDGGEEALLIAALDPARARSVVTWGAAGQIVATPEELTAVAIVVDAPDDLLRPLAAYLVDAYGAQGARIMTASWAEAMRGIVDAGGDISRRRAQLITCPALLIAGTYDPFCPPDLVREMAEAVPRGEFREAAGAGHDVHLSHHHWLSGAVLDWLSSH
jgi:pimeloyl-ACP methyl ester carboxylesterase